MGTSYAYLWGSGSYSGKPPLGDACHYDARTHFIATIQEYANGSED